MIPLNKDVKLSKYKKCQPVNTINILESITKSIKFCCILRTDSLLAFLEYQIQEAKEMGYC